MDGTKAVPSPRIDRAEPKFGKIERHAYEPADLAVILRKEIAEQDRPR